MKVLLKFMLSLIMCFALATPLRAQNTTNLVVGDQVPTLKYSKWLKGLPVISFRKDHLYVIECWATWCGPCIQAMPHISKLADKYKDKATFIGMNVWEKLPADQSYDNVLNSVGNFVEGVGKEMSYNVAVDTEDRSFDKEWLKKAGVTGIPTTFVILNGKLMWLGHPAKLESVMIELLDGTFNLENSRKAHLITIEKAKNAAAKQRNDMAPIEAALSVKNYSRALQVIDSLILNDPMYKYTMSIRKFNVLLDHVGEKQSIAFVEDWRKIDGERVAMYPVQSILERKGLSKEMYTYAAQVLTSAGNSSPSNSPMFLEMTARAYGLAGDFNQAVAYQLKAVEAARESVKLNLHPGIVHRSTVSEFEETLTGYQQKIAARN